MELKIEIPEELEELAHIPKIKWQLVILRKLREEFEELARVKKILSKSKLTQEQADELADEVSLALAKRYEKLLKEK